MKTVSNAPEIKGWCPGALRPMMSGDGLVVRIRPRGGRLTPDQARGIAALALRHGNGLIDLSSRANVQLRGVTDASHGALIAGLSVLGLIDESPEAEARRNIVVTPFWAEGDGTADLVAALSAALAKADAPQTPGKFGYALDCGPTPVLRDVSADIRIERDARGGLLVRADGAATGAVATANTAAGLAVSLARWFLDSGGAAFGRGRMAAHFGKGAVPPDAFQLAPAQAAVKSASRAPGPVPQGFLVGFEFGQMRAETLTNLAGFGALRVTPWRLLLIEGAAVAPELEGLITTRDDPRLRVIACTGAPGCPQGLAPTRILARALAPLLPAGTVLHVSGCAKGCAHPGLAPLTLVAQPGGGFGLIRHGTTTDTPAQSGLTPDMLTQNPVILTENPDAP